MRGEPGYSPPARGGVSQSDGVVGVHLPAHVQAGERPTRCSAAGRGRDGGFNSSLMGFGHDRNMGVQPAFSSAGRTGSGEKTGADLVRARKLSKEEKESLETN